MPEKGEKTMTITESAVRTIAGSVKKDPALLAEFLTDPEKRRAAMERLLDTGCGAEAEGVFVRFDLGCAQPVVPYAELEKAVLAELGK